MKKNSKTALPVSNSSRTTRLHIHRFCRNILFLFSHKASICRILRTVDVRDVPFIPKIEIKKRRISPLDGETRRALMYLLFKSLARGVRKFYKAFPAHARVGLYSLRSRSLWSPPCRVTIPNAKMLFLPIQEVGTFLQPFIHQCSKFASIDRADFRFIFILGIEEFYYRFVLVNLE